MKRKLFVVMLLCFSATSILAHHSVSASHDTSRSVTIQGKVTKVDWTNPHAWITLSVKQADGTVAEQRVEIAGPGRLTKIGVERRYMSVGEVVTFEAWPPKFSGGWPSGHTLILADGRRFDVRDAFGEAQKSPAK